MNTYIKPIVDKHWECCEGVILNEGDAQRFYKTVLLCIHSDVPATRKHDSFIFFYCMLFGFYVIQGSQSFCDIKY